MILAMAPFQLVLILLEDMHFTDVTLGIGYLVIRIIHVSFREHGVVCSQHASVSHKINEDNYAFFFLLYVLL